MEGQRKVTKVVPFGQLRNVLFEKNYPFLLAEWYFEEKNLCLRGFKTHRILSSVHDCRYFFSCSYDKTAMFLLHNLYLTSRRETTIVLMHSKDDANIY